MNKLSIPFVLVVIACVSLTMLSSCKDDDPEPKRKVAFASSSQIVNESDGIIEVLLNLDGAAPEDLIVEYSISGNATRKTSSSTVNPDYEIMGTLGELEINKGETSGVITIKILDDDIFEDDENIVLTIDDVSSTKVDIGTRDQTTITIVSDDAKATVSFAATTFTVKESVGEVELTVQVDKIPTSDLMIAFQLAGSAIDTIRGTNQEIPAQYWDYYIKDFQNNIIIPAGQSSVKVIARIYSDFLLEDPETIEITLTPTAGVAVGTNSKATITVQQEDGKVLALVWDGDSDVDMDLFLWVDELGGTDFFPVALSAFAGNDPALELLFIPKSIANASFGASYIYYEGSDNALVFDVQFADYINGQIEPLENRDVFTGNYTLANINAWDTQAGTDPIIVQTFDQVNSVIQDISEIVKPATGSRIKSYSLPKSLTRKKYENIKPIRF